MKRFLLIAVFSSLLLPAIGQVSFGVKAGLSSMNLDTEDIQIFEEGGGERLGIALDNSDLGLFGGFLVSFQIGAVVIQPEFYFNSNSADFKVTEIDSFGDAFDEVKNEKYQYLDIPLLVGAKFGPLRIMAGPQGHVFLNSTSSLTDIEGYKQDFESLTLGWQGGVGLDLWNISLDFRYEGNFSKFGDHITVDGNRYDFNENPSRLLFSVAWIFLGGNN